MRAAAPAAADESMTEAAGAFKHVVSVQVMLKTPRFPERDAQANRVRWA
jgi:hypothetical protein